MVAGNEAQPLRLSRGAATSTAIRTGGEGFGKG
jgi:hypothetical protein